MRPGTAVAEPEPSQLVSTQLDSTELGGAQPEATELDAPADADLLQAGFVLFRLGGTAYAVGMDVVAEVGRLPALTRVPGTPPWLGGLANWRGRILAVLDVRPLFGAAANPTGTLGRLLVLGQGGVTIGLLTEGVQGVLEGLDEHLEAPPTTLSSASRALLLGQVTRPAGPIAVLDPTAVLDLRHQLPTSRRPGV